MNGKILVVDDFEENRIILEEILKDTYTIETAKDGLDAVSKLVGMEEKPELILSDVMMPAMDGFDLLAFIKADGKMRNIPVIFITAANEEEKGLNAGAIDFISKPFKPEVIRLRVANQIELAQYRDKMEALVAEKANELVAVKENFLETLATMFEFRSLESGQHIKRTKTLTGVLIEQLLTVPRYEKRLKSLDPTVIVKASVLHDIGKIGIPDSILHKPGKLTHEEFEIIKTHTIIGSEMIATMLAVKEDEYVRHCYDIARHHHEKWNGMGYPDGLKGEEIPLSARIVALVDVYDALVSERAYKKAISHEEAMSIIIHDSGTHFDPGIVEAAVTVQDRLHENEL